MGAVYGRLGMTGVQKLAMDRRYWLAGVACDNDSAVRQLLCTIMIYCSKY